MNRPGIIATMRALAKVPALGRSELCDNTVNTYAHLVRKFAAFAAKPAGEWTGADVAAWMHQLAEDGYADKSRRQALCAVVWVFKHVLRVNVGDLNLPVAPKEKRRLKIIPNAAEIGRLLGSMRGMPRIMGAVIYGSGLRVMECCTLRVKDLDFDALTIRVHSGKGDKDRLVNMPRVMETALRKWVAWREALHLRDIAEGAGFVELPGRLALKYKNAPRELAWQFLFPSQNIVRGYRWHAVPESLQKAMRAARTAAGITKIVTPHTLRHAFATHSMRCGNDIATVSELMGHTHIETTQIYVHADRASGVSPMDAGPLLGDALRI